MRTLFLSLPTAIRGFVVRCFDDECGDAVFTIVLNSNISYDEQIKTYLHERDHILHGDFDSCLSVNQIESMRH